MIGPAPQTPLDDDQKEDTKAEMPDDTADHRAASGSQWWVLFGAIFVVGAVLFVHLEIWPLLPIEVSPEDASCLLGLALVAMLTGGLTLLLRLSMLAVTGFSQARQRIFPRRARVRCPECGAWDTAEHFLEVQACWQCGADRVQCARCEAPQAVGRYVSGEGCSNCGHDQFATWR